MKTLSGLTEEEIDELKPFREVLGDRMPGNISFDNVGRFKLMRAMRDRFGANFRNVEKARELMSFFDREVRYREVLKKYKGDKK